MTTLLPGNGCLIHACVLSLICLAPSSLRAQQAQLVPSLGMKFQPFALGSYSSKGYIPDPSNQDSHVLQQTPNPEEHTDGQTKRILGIVPNFRAVSANTHLPPQSVKDRFVTATEDSFDYSSIVLPATIAGIDLARNATPEFGKGFAGYGRYLWHSVVDQTVENYMVEFVVPTITHEDTRYYTLGKGGFLRRGKYAATRVVITRSDSGREVFNASEIFGSGAAAGISTFYYPARERSFGNTGSQWGLDVGIDAVTFVFKEFWPDINHALFHGKTPYKDAFTSMTH